MMTFNGELLEIFSWLPGKHLYELSSACKSSMQLLTEDFFIKKQSKNMQLVGDTDFIIEPDYCQRYKTNIEYHALMLSPSQREKACPSLPKTSLEFLEKTGRVLASSNGLLCCRNTSYVENRGNPLFLFNPSTKRYLTIPLPHENLSDYRDKDFNIVFGCEKDVDDFMLLALVSPPDWTSKFHCRIYSSQEKIWKDGGRPDLGGRGIIFENSIYQNGVVYMVSDTLSPLGSRTSDFYWPYLVVYDIKNSTSRFLKIPNNARKGIMDAVQLRIFKWGKPNSSLNSICLVKLKNKAFTIWVLNVDPITSCFYWKRVFGMRVKAMGLKQSCCIAGFTIVNGSVLLLATEDRVYAYDISLGSKGQVQEVCGHKCGENVCFKLFSSTLRPCGPGEITLK